jgi:NADH-quinone oxidoreductase subunit H
MMELGPLLSHGFSTLREFLGSLGWSPLQVLVATKVLQTSVTIALILAVPLVLVYGERKISAFMQARIGPLHTGPWGLFQTFADTVKLLFKEDIVPTGANRLLHLLAVVFAVAPVFVCFAPIPFGRNLTLINLDTGVLFIFAISGLSTLGVLVGGWASANKFSMLGGLRGTAQLISYEIPRILSVVPVVMWYSSLNLQTIATAQTARWHGWLPKWFIFYPVVGQLAFLVFLIASVAETNRVPFDIPEAESELVSGYHTEFSGMKFAFFFLAEYVYVFLAGVLGTTLFFGGGDGPSFLPSWVWFLAKTSVIVFLFLWFRWTYPRMRVDRLMSFCWKFLLPVSLMTIAIAAIWLAEKGVS